MGTNNPLRKKWGILFILLFCATSWNLHSGFIGGCNDQPPSPAETSYSNEGDAVDVSGNLPPPVGGNDDNPSVSMTPTPVNPTLSFAPGNVILVVASGMGPQQVGQVIQYRRLRKPFEEPLALEKLMAKKNMGLASTHSYLDIVSDTSSANSSIACGLKVRNNTLGLNPNGDPCETILEKAIAMGKATGLVSNGKLSHPGIASYAAHQLNRQSENEIAHEIINDKNIDLILAGGLTNLIPQYSNESSSEFMKMSDLEECNTVNPILDGQSSREDQTNLVEVAKEKGYQFFCNLDQLNSIDANTNQKLLGIFSNSRFPLSPDRKEITSLPSLAQMTEKALSILSQKENGFFLVIHGALTHCAARDNDAGSLLQEALDFDAAVQKAMEFAEANSDTLLIVTSDHETGGFGFSYSKQAGAELDLPSGEHYDAPYNYAPFIRFDLLIDQRKSFSALTTDILQMLYGDEPTLTLDSAAEMLVSDVELHTPYRLNLGEAKKILERKPGKDNATTQDFPEFFVHDNIHTNLIGRAIARQTSTVWSSGTPTSTPVIILAMGPEKYADRVRGFIDNTEIAKIIEDALKGK